MRPAWDYVNDSMAAGECVSRKYSWAADAWSTPRFGPRSIPFALEACRKIGFCRRS